MATPKRPFPWLDLYIFGTFSLISLVTTLWCLIRYELAPEAIVALILSTAGFIGVSALIIVGKLLTRPTFVTRHNTWVWTNNTYVTRDLMESAIDMFIYRFPIVVSEAVHSAVTAVGVPSKTSSAQITSAIAARVTDDAMRNMFAGARIEWRDSSITMVGLGWHADGKAGLQKGKGIVVQWNGTIIGSAFIHELLHMVDEVVLQREPDYKHERKEWWALEAQLPR